MSTTTAERTRDELTETIRIARLGADVEPSARAEVTAHELPRGFQATVRFREQSWRFRYSGTWSAPNDCPPWVLAALRYVGLLEGSIE